MLAERLPDWFGPVAARLVEAGAFAQPPNQVLLNEYDVATAAGAAGGGGGAGGGIAPHNDGPLFEPVAAILTLGSPAVLHFWPRPPPAAAGAAAGASAAENGWAAVDGVEPVCSVLLEPRSLLVFGQAAYTTLLHGIFPVAVEALGPTVCNLAHCTTQPPPRAGDVVARGRRLSLTVRRVGNVKKEVGDFFTADDEAEITRRWAWWRRAISERKPAPAPPPLPAVVAVAEAGAAPVPGGGGHGAGGALHQEPVEGNGGVRRH
eukprot:SAG22_NODE_3215_length_1852_cov_1.387336_2_plen_262_part_00